MNIDLSLTWMHECSTNLDCGELWFCYIIHRASLHRKKSEQLVLYRGQLTDYGTTKQLEIHKEAMRYCLKTLIPINGASVPCLILSFNSDDLYAGLKISFVWGTTDSGTVSIYIHICLDFFFLSVTITVVHKLCSYCSNIGSCGSSLWFVLLFCLLTRLCYTLVMCIAVRM